LNLDKENKSERNGMSDIRGETSQGENNNNNNNNKEALVKGGCRQRGE